VTRGLAADNWVGIERSTASGQSFWGRVLRGSRKGGGFLFSQGRSREGEVWDQGFKEESTSHNHRGMKEEQRGGRETLWGRLG